MTDIQDRLNKLEETINQERKMFLGYPCNAAFDYSELYRFLSYPLNNIGDPYLASNVAASKQAGLSVPEISELQKLKRLNEGNQSSSGFK